MYAIALGALLVSMLSSARPCFAAIVLADMPRLIGEDLEEWVDTSATASAAEALAHGAFRRPSRSRPNHGVTDAAIFYRFSLRNGTLARGAYVLEVAPAVVPEVDLYRVLDGGGTTGGRAELEARAGEHIPRAERGVPCEVPAFAIELDPGEERTYLLRLAGPAAISLLGDISPRATFFEEYTRGVLLWGGFYGVVLGIALYVAVGFAFLRDAKWQLAPALLGVALVEASRNGHLARLIPFVVPDLEQRGCSLGLAVVLLALCQSARVVLDTRATPRMDRVLRIGGILAGAFCLVSGVILRFHAPALVGPLFAARLLVASAVFPTLLVFGALRWRAGHAPARPFVVAMAALNVPGSLISATLLGLLPLCPIVESANHVGEVIMAALLALGASQEMRAARATVTALGDDLRDQIVRRSRELTRVLERSGPSMGTPSLATGTVFDERYRVVRPLGEGGMGAVYEVVRTRDDRHFALKVLTSTASATALRLTREAEIGANLRHPNLVSIVDVGLQNDHAPFLVMELVLGGSLEDRRADFGDVGWALGVLRGVAAGLHALHGAGIIHRDLKPSNVLMNDRVARISDFGIATRFHDEGRGGPSPPSRLTASGAIVGTPLYMAPEAIAKATLAPSADVFAFGLIAFELLTGEYPLALFAEASIGPVAPVPAASLARVAALPSPIRARLEACVAMDPTMRPSASELDALLNGSSATSAD